MLQLSSPDKDAIHSASNSTLKRKRAQTPTKEHTLDVSLRKSLLGDAALSLIGLSCDLGMKRPRLLRIEIPPAYNSGLFPAENGEYQEESHSLFSESDSDSLFDDIDEEHASPLQTVAVLDGDSSRAFRHSPPIQGLYFDPSVVLPQELANEVTSFCMKTYFTSPADNQVMLFGRFLPLSETLAFPPSTSGLPPILTGLLDTIASLLRPVVPPRTYDLLFPAHPTRARQAIINLYQPGEGITPHVDLFGRYGDGIIGVSFSSGSVMRFDKVDPHETDPKTRWDVYLPERSVIVLSEDARYVWTHGIEKKHRDYVFSDSGSSDDSEPAGDWIDRGTRMSVTFRWLLPGADVVGDA